MIRYNNQGIKLLPYKAPTMYTVIRQKYALHKTSSGWGHMAHGPLWPDNVLRRGQFLARLVFSNEKAWLLLNLETSLMLAPLDETIFLWKCGLIECPSLRLSLFRKRLKPVLGLHVFAIDSNDWVWDRLWISERRFIANKCSITTRPTLFLICINDLPDSLPLMQFMIFSVIANYS